MLLSFGDDESRMSEVKVTTRRYRGMVLSEPLAFNRILKKRWSMKNLHFKFGSRRSSDEDSLYGKICYDLHPVLTSFVTFPYDYHDELVRFATLYHGSLYAYQVVLRSVRCSTTMNIGNATHLVDRGLNRGNRNKSQKSVSEIVVDRRRACFTKISYDRILRSVALCQDMLHFTTLHNVHYAPLRSLTRSHDVKINRDNRSKFFENQIFCHDLCDFVRSPRFHHALLRSLRFTSIGAIGAIVAKSV
ncbi:hypothetical protein FSP39_012911 [Pinctada imbricata]|uniref:Uncharacterized protein n=1 Tax=Pinctada imbricata TaxID=66713 RepID=A0AA88Y3J6_PINIB|nr:hypothetical protein FSP39_012911 [Pinctada imbricata]